MVYDLAEGSVLVVQYTRGETTLRQLRRALSDTSADSQGVARFAAVNPCFVISRVG